MPELKAVIFDFDGTILDTEYIEYASWQALFRDYGQGLSMEWWMSIVGKRGEDIPVLPHDYLESLLVHSVDRDEVRERRNSLFEAALTNERTLPGVLELMDAVEKSGIPLAIASNSDRESVMKHMAPHVSATRFQAMTFRDDVSKGKPDPEIYNTVLATLRVRPEEAAAIEDSPTGIAAARAAGVYCVAVPNRLTQAMSFDHASRIVKSLAAVSLGELKEAIAGSSDGAGNP